MITMKAQIAEKTKGWRSDGGRSLIEVLAVVAIASILTAVALPQVISARRMIRSASLPREIASELRYTRQQAMAQMQAATFQYDDTTKQITIYDHNNVQNPNPACNLSRTQILTAPNFPATACSTVLLSVPLAGGSGLPATEVTFGVPTGVANTTLGDTTTPTALVSNKLTVTFQPNGTVQDANGNSVNRTLFFYNNKIPNQTAFAISILGSAGRIKIWRYTPSASQYIE